MAPLPGPRRAALIAAVVAIGAAAAYLSIGRCGNEGTPAGKGTTPPAGDPSLRVVDAAAAGDSKRITSASSTGSVAFVGEEMTFEIARDYDQRASVAIESRAANAVALVADVGALDGGLLGDFVGEGSQEQPLVLGARAKATLTLAMFAQDASRRAYTTHVDIRDAKSRELLASAPVTFFVRQPAFSLDVRVGDASAATLARLITIRNDGDLLTDLSVEAGQGLRGRVRLVPTIDHALLPAHDLLAVRVEPELHTGFASLEGEIVLKGGGGVKTVPLHFALPPGKRFYVGTSGSTSSYEATGTWCTNNPNTSSWIGGPFEIPSPSEWCAIPIPGVGCLTFGGHIKAIRKGPPEHAYDHGAGGGRGRGAGRGRALPRLNFPDAPNGAPQDDGSEPTPGSSASSGAPGELYPPQGPKPGLESEGGAVRRAADSIEGVDDLMRTIVGIGSARGARVREAYLDSRPWIEEDNVVEAHWSTAPDGAAKRLCAAVWHTDVFSGGAGRGILFHAWRKGEERGVTRLPVALNAPGTWGRWPTVLLLPDRRVLVAWEQSPSADGPTAILCRIGEPGYARWSPPIPVPGTDGSEGSHDPVGVDDAAGRARLFWQRGAGSSARILTATIDLEGAFGPAVEVAGLPPGAARPVARRAEDGSLHLAVEAPGSEAEGRGPQTAVFHARLAIDGTRAEKVTRVSPPGTDAGEPDLLPRAGALHLAFRAGPPWASRILVASSADDGATWGEAAPATPDDWYAEYPTLYPHAGGDVGLQYFASPVSARGSGAPLQRFHRFGTGTAWGEPRRGLTGFPSVESAWLQTTFTLADPRGQYGPHELRLLFNGQEILRREGDPAEGTFLLPLDTRLLRVGEDGIPRNQVGIRTKHLRSGHYAAVAKFRLEARHSFLERLVVASSQEEADSIVAAESGDVNHARPDVGIFANETAAPPADPRKGEPIRLAFTVANLGEGLARGVRLAAYATGPDVSGTPKGEPLAASAVVGDLPPTEARRVEIEFPFPGGRECFVVVRGDGDDFDTANNVHRVSFAVSRPAAIEPLSPPAGDLPLAVRLLDDPEPPYLWRFLDGESGKEVARILKGRLSGTLSPGRYHLALQRWQSEGGEVRWPHAIDLRAGASTRFKWRTALELVLPAWADSAFRWEAVRGDKPDEVVQWHRGSQRVMLLPPGDYRVAVQPTQFTTRRLVWPEVIHLGEDEHRLLRLDSGIEPPPTALATDPPYEWSIFADGSDEPVQAVRGSWDAVALPPGTYRWGVQPFQFTSGVARFEEALEVRPGRLARPSAPAALVLFASDWIGTPYAHRLRRAADGKVAQEFRGSVGTPVFVSPGEYDLEVRPAQFNCRDIVFAKGLRLPAGITTRVTLDAGIDVQGAAGAAAPWSIALLAEGVKEPVQTTAGWGPRVLPPGVYRIALQQTQWASAEVRWPTSVTVRPGALVRVPIDCGLRIVGPPGAAPAFEFRILDPVTKAEVQHGKDTWDPQWLPPATYALDVRAEGSGEWKTLAEGVVVTAGRVTDVPLPRLPTK